MKKIFFYCGILLVIAIAIFFTLEIIKKTDRNENADNSLAFSIPLVKNMDVRNQVLSPDNRKTFDVFNERYKKLQGIIEFPDTLEYEIREIFKEKNLRKDDPNALLRAGRIAGAYRMSYCAPALVDIITLHYEIEPQFILNDSRSVFFREQYVSIEEDLILIGKPAIPHILKLASSSDATCEELEAVGRVLTGIEGDLAYYVVEDYIKKSTNPEETRKLMEREPFKRFWQKKD